MPEMPSIHQTRAKYRSYLSFGFNCEVGFALQYMSVFQPTLFSWADVRGTDALLFGIKNPELLLSESVTPYAGNMFFCELSKIGFHGKIKFSEALGEDGQQDLYAIKQSLEETRSRIKHLEFKQKQAFDNGGVLVIVKYFSDVFVEPYGVQDSMRLVRDALSERYKTNDFDLLYVISGSGAGNVGTKGNDFLRIIGKFSHRSHASEIDKDGWEAVLKDFVVNPESVLSEPLEKAAKYWSEKKTSDRTRWWLEPTIVNYVNKLICGEEVAGPSAGIHHKLKSLSQGMGFRKGISIACGNGAKELQLIKIGLVDQFDLYEISSTRVEQGIKLAHQLGLQNKVRFHITDAFHGSLDTDFDLVYWDSALHHMFDVDAAIRWSRDRLIAGGCFFMHDYVGATRFQHSDFQCAVASRVRQLLPERLLRNPNSPGSILPREITRPNLSKLISIDPTEAADSGNILSALKTHFSNINITLTGGAIYHTALNDVMANFEQEDKPLLMSLLLLDEMLSKLGESHFAIATAKKE